MRVVVVSTSFIPTTMPKCKECKRSFDKPRGLSVHLRAAHGITRTKPKAQPKGKRPKAKAKRKTAQVSKGGTVDTRVATIQPAAYATHLKAATAAVAQHTGQSRPVANSTITLQQLARIILQLLRDSGVASAFWAQAPTSQAFTHQAAKGGFLAAAARSVLPAILQALRYALPKLLAGAVGGAGSAAIQKAIKAATGGTVVDPRTPTEIALATKGPRRPLGW